jgi:cell division septal protein FtsQ
MKTLGKQPKKKIGRYVLAFLVLAGAVGVLTHTAGYRQAKQRLKQVKQALSPRLNLANRMFRIKEITVTGCRNLSAAEITAFSGLTPNQGLYSFSARTLEANLSRFPGIRNVQVSRILPGQVHIALEEFEPCFWMADPDLRVLASDGGILAARVAQNLDLPFITGLGSGDLGRRRAAVQRAISLWQWVQDEQPDMNQEISEIFLGEGDELELVLRTGCRVIIAPDSWQEGLEKLRSLQFRHLNEQTKILDLKYKGLAYAQ